MRRVGLRALLAGVMTVGLASVAWAGTAERDDLVDVNNSMIADSVDSPAASNFANLFLNDGGAFASGSINNGGNSTTFTGVFWQVFEPDQTKRSSSSGQVQQRDELFMEVFLANGNTPIFAGVVPGCKAKLNVKAPKGSLTPADVNKGNWSVNCNKKANDTMLLTDQQLTDLQTALGKKVVGKNSLNIKGKCTDANCDD